MDRGVGLVGSTSRNGHTRGTVLWYKEGQATRLDVGIAMDRIERVIAEDGSRKYLFHLGERLRMEAAYFFVPSRKRPHIACVSTQVGCAVGCPFCAASKHRFFRNLTAEEIFLEVSTIVGEAVADRVSKELFEVSFMGMGEPLANLRNLLLAIQRICEVYPEISRVSVSTAGSSKRIQALTQAMPVQPPVHLQISLHATDERLRRKLIPFAQDSIDRLLASGNRFHQTTGDQVCLNYILLRGLNDRPRDAEWLARLDPSAYYVKITKLNATMGMPVWLVGASLGEIMSFAKRVRVHGMLCKIFVGDGLDVDASCGQMAATPVQLSMSGPSMDRVA